MDDSNIEFPEWMIQYSQALKAVESKEGTPPTKPGQVQGFSDSGNLFESHEKYSRITSPQESGDDVVNRLQHAGDIAFECERLLNSASCTPENLLLGLDLDWPSSYKAFIAKTESIHLCYGENHCLLLEVLHTKKLPLVFIQLLKHPNVRLLGHNIVEDLLKLGKDFNFDVKQIITSNLLLSPAEKKLSCKHKWSYSTNKSPRIDQFEDFKSVPASHTTAGFTGKIKYCTSFEECAIYSEELLIRADHCDQLPLGFDLEWPFSYGRGQGKVALVQICPDETICYIFHVFHLKSLPKALVLLLRHPNVRLTGLNITNDVRKLGRDFNIDLSEVIANNLIELSTFANQQLRCSHRWSLAGLVANQLKIDLDKGAVRVSNWAKKDLSKKQIEYAATDAYVSQC